MTSERCKISAKAEHFQHMAELISSCPELKGPKSLIGFDSLHQCILFFSSKSMTIEKKVKNILMIKVSKRASEIFEKVKKKFSLG